MEYLKMKSDLLKEFDQDIILKSTAHTVDKSMSIRLLEEMNITEYSYETHIKYINKRYTQFICNNNVSSFEKYMLNKIISAWNHSSVKEWCDKNPNKYPNAGFDLDYWGMELKESIWFKSGKHANTFNQLITIFRNKIL